MSIKQLYQGDIPFIKGIEKQDLKTKRMKKEGLVVEVGEATNHEHRVIPQVDTQINYTEYLNGWYMEIKKGQAIVTHPEHDTITLDEGVYYVGKQYEYDELSEFKKVSD